MHTQRLNHRTMVVLALGATLLTGLVLALTLLSTARAEEVLTDSDPDIANLKISQDTLDDGQNTGESITPYIDATEYEINSTGDYVVFIANPAGAPDTNELFSVELPNGEPVQLNELNPAGRVFDFIITPDGTTVIFRVAQMNSSRPDLYAVPIAGGATTWLNENTTAIPDQTNQGVISGNYLANNNRVVFEVQRTMPAANTNWLYSATLDGSSVAALHTPTDADDDIIDFDFDTSDDTNPVVAYVVDDIVDDDSTDPSETNIFSIPIDGTGTATKLNSAAPLSTSIQSGILIDTFDDQVYFRADLDGTETVSDTNLYRAILGSPGSEVQINNDLTDPFSTTVEADFKLDSDGEVVYRANATTNDLIQLYRAGTSAPISQGSLPVPPPANPETEEVFVIAGTTVYYVGGDDLYSYDGSNTQLVDASEVEGDNKTFANITDLDITPDGSYILFRGDLRNSNVPELYSLATSGGTLPVRLNEGIPGSTIVESYGSAPDSSFVVYIADEDANNVDELYRIAPDGTPLSKVKLNGTLVSGGGVAAFKISSDTSNDWVVYNADQETNNVFELFLSYNAPELSITKTDSRTDVAREGTLVYTIEYTNASTSIAAPDVVITDTLPTNVNALFSNLEFGSSAGINETLSTPPNVYTWNVGTLAPAASGTIIITATVDTDAPLGEITNQVEISSSLLDDTTDNSDSESVNVISSGPDVSDESYTTAEDTPLEVTTDTEGVLANDNAPSGTLAATLQGGATTGTTAENGTVTLNPNGTFIYTPTANFFGTDSFVYTVTEFDGTTELGSANGTANINVTAVNDPPTIDPLEDLDLLIIATDSPSQTIDLSGITSGASNEDQTLSVTAAATDTQGLINSIEVNYTSPNETGTVVFTPTAGLNGTTGIEVTVNDGQATNATTSTVRSVLIRPSGYQFTSTAPTTATVGVEYSYDITVQPVGLANQAELDITLDDDHGWLTLEHTTGEVNATLSGTPTADLAGQEFEVTLTASDGTYTDTQTFTITVGEEDGEPPRGDTTLGVTLTSVPADTVATGETLTYNVAVNNTGTVTEAVNITVTLTLPPATVATYTQGDVSSTDAAWTFDETDVATTGVITATRDTLAAGGSANFTAPVTVVAESGTVDASVSAEAANSTNTPVAATSSVTVGDTGPTGTTLYLPFVAR